VTYEGPHTDVVTGEEGHHHHHDSDHSHDDEAILPLEQQPLWIMDNIQLTSVGIDIGTSGTKLAFSKIKLRRNGINLTSRYDVISRELMYHSDLRFTPYTGNHDLIDEKALKKIIDEEYFASGLAQEDVDTGAVILTGEAIRRENAEAVGNVLALRGGKFVTVTAGHNQEAMLAAFGSGAVELSLKKKCRLLNLDVGGGTAKFTLIDNGQIVATCALAVGGRLMVFDSEGRITRLEPNAIFVSKLLGFNWQLGRKVASNEIEAVAGWMAKAVLNVVKGEVPEATKKLALTPLDTSLSLNIAGVVASGGVAEYIYRTETRYFNDLAESLGASIRKGLLDLNLEVFPASERIRATVMGVAEYTLQVSGNTIYISDGDSLPFRNLQVLRPDFECTDVIDAGTLAKAITKHFTLFDISEGEKTVALMFHWNGDPAYERLGAFADGVARAMKETIAKQLPLILVFDEDVGKTLGAILREEKKVEVVICIDGILLQDFDFIDIGRQLQPHGVVPVTVKSLAFESSSSKRE
jgi:ethanolamine utilization protein EutA